MPRGWHQLPGGWWQRSIRGPRPPSENWPRAQPSRQPGSAPRQERSPLQPPLLRQPCRAPEVVVNDAIGEIKSFEAAIDLLGPSSVHAKLLQIALKAAQQRSKVGPIQERLDSCRQFIESQEACASCRRSDRQGCRAESNFRSGSCTGRATSCDAPGRSSCNHPCSGSRARSSQGVADTAIFWCGSAMH